MNFLTLPPGKRAFARLGVALAATGAHASALGGGFVWLDHAHLEQGVALAKPSEFGSLFVGGFAGTGFYRPLVSLVLSLEALLGGSALSFHLATLFWHVLAALLVTVAGASLGLSFEAQILAGLLFAVHPATSLVASAIAFQSEAMALVALLALITFHSKNKQFFAFFALIFGTFCKETALALAPIFIVALEYERWRSRSGPPTESRIKLLVAEGCALLLAFVCRALFAPAWRAQFPTFTGSEALGTRLAALWKSATTLLPVGLGDRSLCDAFPVQSLTSESALLGGLCLLSLIYLARRGRGPAIFFFLALLPSLQLFPIQRWWSPHYLYIALAFGAMLVAQALVESVRRPLAWAVAAALVLGAQAFTDDLRFRTDETLWEPEVRMRPGCREGAFYLAEVQRERGQWRQAAAGYEQALKPTPGVLAFVDVKAASVNLGVAHLNLQQPQEARRAFARALGLVTDGQELRHLLLNLATAEFLSGDAARAVRTLAPEVARSDALPEGLLLSARALHQLGHNEEARALIHRLGSRAANLHSEEPR